METCSEEMHPYVMVSIIQSVMEKNQERGPWLYPRTIKSALSGEQEEELLKEVKRSQRCLDVSQIKITAQKQEPGQRGLGTDEAKIQIIFG